jgi:hypothetical protein
MNTKLVYVYDESGLFVGTYFAQEDPESPGDFIRPVLSTELPLPAVPDGFFARFDGEVWNILPIPAPEVPPPLTGNALIQSQIRQKEATVTQRRLREATLGTDNGWLQALDAEIAVLRGQLT